MFNTVKIIFTLGILFFGGFVVIATQNNLLSEQYFIDISKPNIIEEDQYIKVNFDESTSFISEIGKPMIPIVSKQFILPFGSKIINVDVSFSDPDKISLKKQIKPLQEPKSINSIINKKDENIKDNKIYNNPDLYPTTESTYNKGSGLYGNEHIMYLTVHCHPVRYSPSRKTLYYSENIKINVLYEPPSEPFTALTDDYDLVIIAPKKFSDTLQPLIKHKNNYNVKTLLKTTEDILGFYQGRDEPEQIKYFIKDIIENYNAKYVLLVGDMELMPMRITDINIWEDDGIPTDLYYADIYDGNGNFCSWDIDNDGKFGEFDWRQGDLDKVDLYADVKVGRIPCKNSWGLKTAINKIITYETQTYGSDWFNNAVLMGGDTFPGHGPNEGEVVTEEVSKQIPEFNKIMLWTSTGNYNPRNINQKITEGAGFVSYSGHGYEFGFGTSSPDDEDRIEYYTPYTIGMLNNKMYPIIFFDACSTAKIDYNLYGFKIPCFAWYLIEKSVGGAIATIGATRVAFTHVDDEGVHGGASYLNVHFFKAYELGLAISEMLVSAQNDYISNSEWKDCITLEEFILVGDPSLKVGGYPSSQTLEIDNEKIIKSFPTLETIFDNTIFFYQ